MFWNLCRCRQEWLRRDRFVCLKLRAAPPFRDSVRFPRSVAVPDFVEDHGENYRLTGRIGIPILRPSKRKFRSLINLGVSP